MSYKNTVENLEGSNVGIDLSDPTTNTRIPSNATPVRFSLQSIVQEKEGSWGKRVEFTP
jgi:hypothetical protein